MLYQYYIITIAVCIFINDTVLYNHVHAEQIRCEYAHDYPSAVRSAFGSNRPQHCDNSCRFLSTFLLTNGNSVGHFHNGWLCCKKEGKLVFWWLLNSSIKKIHLKSRMLAITSGHFTSTCLLSHYLSA